MLGFILVVMFMTVISSNKPVVIKLIAEICDYGVITIKKGSQSNVKIRPKKSGINFYSPVPKIVERLCNMYINKNRNQ